MTLTCNLVSFCPFVHANHIRLTNYHLLVKSKQDSGFLSNRSLTGWLFETFTKITELQYIQSVQRAMLVWACLFRIQFLKRKKDEIKNSKSSLRAYPMPERCMSLYSFETELYIIIRFIRAATVFFSIFQAGLYLFCVLAHTWPTVHWMTMHCT